MYELLRIQPPVLLTRFWPQSLGELTQANVLFSDTHYLLEIFFFKWKKSRQLQYFFASLFCYIRRKQWPKFDCQQQSFQWRPVSWILRDSSSSTLAKNALLFTGQSNLAGFTTKLWNYHQCLDIALPLSNQTITSVCLNIVLATSCENKCFINAPPGGSSLCSSKLVTVS